MCSASTRKNWSFRALISPYRVSSKRKHCSFHCCASWRSCAISSAWCLFCVVECGGKEGEKASQLDRPKRARWDKRSSPQVTHYLPANKRRGVSTEEGEIDDTRQCGTGTDTRLCLPSVHICDPRPILLLKSADIPWRVVTFVSQDAQVILGLVESCAGPMLVSTQLEMDI